jgi:hypothetical protein
MYIIIGVFANTFSSHTLGLRALAHGTVDMASPSGAEGPVFESHQSLL